MFATHRVHPAASDVKIIALTAGKAVVVINGGRPRTMSAGESTPDGVKVVSATATG